MIHAAEVGRRYSDDSGWELYVRVDRQEGRVTLIAGGGGEYTLAVADAEWLLGALQKLLGATKEKA